MEYLERNYEMNFHAVLPYYNCKNYQNIMTFRRIYS